MNELQGWRLWALIALGIVALGLPMFIQNDYLMQVFFRIALFAALGLAWNLVGGYAGQLSLGHAAFFGLGAYGLAIASAHGVPRWIAFILAPLLATAFAAIIGKIVFRPWILALVLLLRRSAGSDYASHQCLDFTLTLWLLPDGHPRR
jgi:branched-chain amino acid transport system permease protein